MRCAIMQPTYLPWAGYFHLMGGVDVFVFLDNAQLQKNSWHSRNRILLKNEPHWITVPVYHVALDQPLNETVICEEKKWRRKHATTLNQTYARHPYRNVVAEIATFIEQDDAQNLALLNMRLIGYFAKKLGINTPIRLASQILVEGKRTERILNILQAIRATTYISPVGAAGYLQEDGFTEQEDIVLRLLNFSPKPYMQRGLDAFIPCLSVIDVLANLGWDGTAGYIQSTQQLSSDL